MSLGSAGAGMAFQRYPKLGLHISVIGWSPQEGLWPWGGHVSVSEAIPEESYS